MFEWTEICMIKLDTYQKISHQQENAQNNELRIAAFLLVNFNSLSMANVKRKLSICSFTTDSLDKIQK